MPPAVRPANEASRLEALHRYDILDTGPEAGFDRLARIAAALLDAPIALVSLIDGSRQWFKAKVGIDQQETPRDWAFCGHALLQQEPLVVLDAPADPRFADNPLVTGAPGIRFYVGAQLHTPAGEALGTLCVIDRTPRPPPDPARVAILRDLADLVMEEMELRRAGRAARADARAQHETTDRVQKALQAMQAAYKAKSAFLLSLSHELRSPLNAVIGFSDLIAGDPEERDEIRGYARDILESGNQMLSVITDILEYSRLEASSSAFQRSITPVARLIEETSRMVAVFARSRGVTLRQQITWPECQVIGDAIRIKQVLLNLLTNAIKFTPEGGMITVTLLRNADGEAEIQVSDTGIGIAPADIPRVLTPFGQLVPQDGTVADQICLEGTGLGLPISKALMAQHGGTLTIASTPGLGTCVTVRLPATVSQTPESEHI